MWYLGLSLTTSSMVKVIPTFPIAFPMAKTTYTPNFSLLGLPHGLKQGPVALGPGPGHVIHWEVHPNNDH